MSSREGGPAGPPSLSFIVSAPMRTLFRSPLILMSALAFAFALGGCGSANGVSDQRFVDALNLTSQQGSYVMDHNPAFCSISKLLHTSSEVHDAAKSGGVVASGNGTVGIQVVTPFAPACRREAEQGLDKLAKKG
jgi:hypothetical protein